MKRQVMQPFRAPRQQNAKSSPTRQSPRRQGKQQPEVQDVPSKKGIRMMSYREALETSTYGEVLRWSSDSEGAVEETNAQTNKAQKDTTESEEPTALGSVWQPLVVKETQYSDVEELLDNGKCAQTGQQFINEAHSERSPLTHSKQPAMESNAASPSCSEFEAFLDKASAAAVAPKTKSTRDAYWENVLESEKQRFAMEIGTRMISVDDIMLGDESSDDNLPIAATLSPKNKNLSLLVDVATKTQSSPSIRKKKTPKVYFPNP